MRLAVATLALALVGIAYASAQTAAPAPAVAPTPSAPTPVAAQPAATTPDPSTLTKDGKVRLKVVRAQCRDELAASGVKGLARREAMAACLIKARPDKAAQIKCAMDPQTKGMEKDVRRAFVKDCVGKAKG